MDLIAKLQNIEKATSEEEKKSIHFKSLKNFIEHYDFVKKEKKKITELLEEYIYILESNNYSFSRDESLVMFGKYIAILGNSYYSKHLGFTNYLGVGLQALLFFLFNSIVWLCFKMKFLFLIGFGLSLCIVANYYYKMKSGKIYGFRY